MTHKRSKTVIASAVSLALASMMLAGSAYAGVIRNTNPTPDAPLGSCGLPDQAATQGCIGAMDLANVKTTIYKADGTPLGIFDPDTGNYPKMGLADYFISLVMSGTTEVAKLSGKVWPVGEPMAVKAVVGDMKTKEGKPNNCIINTAFLSADKNPTGVSGYLDTANPVPVICSSDFQSHKRFKIPMQPASLDPANTPIDLVFNVVDESAAGNPPGLPSLPNSLPLVNPNTNNLRYYQVFTKINNYTGKRLAGYKVVVGTGVGSAFKSASELGIADKLHLSIGIGEGWSTGSADSTPPSLPNGTDLVDEDGAATFSHGLFGGIDDKHWFANGFFDERTAGFEVAQKCTTAAGADTNCPANYPNPLFDNTLPAMDTVYSTDVKLPSNYNGPVVPAGTPGFPWGDWLPYGWEPKGIYWDFDNDPTTDADIVAWWNGSAWVKNYDSGFAPVSAAEFNAWASDKSCGTASEPKSCYAIDTIEDALNLGINYTLKVGDNIDGDNDPATNPQITIRIVPLVAADQTAPVWVDTTPPPLVPTSTTPITPITPVVSDSGGGGGGCTIGSDGRFDPTLPAMLFAGLGFLGWRRYKAGK